MNAIAPLQRLVVNPTARHTATVVFVHGLGDTGEGWEPVARMLARDQALAHIKWVLPHAPFMRVTANGPGGPQMPSWFDIVSFDFNRPSNEDETGMNKTVYSLNKLIETELDELAPAVPANRIVLGGFSQGGAMSLLTGLTTERRLAGIACLSGWVPLRTSFKSKMTEYASKLPIFWGHGSADPLVPFQLAQRSKDLLLGAGIKEASEKQEGVPTGLEFHKYDGIPHSVAPQEIDDLGTWLKRVIPQTE